MMPTDAKERQENEEGIVTIGLIDFLLKPELLNW